MNLHEPFVRSIAGSLYDDTLRLVAADRLEDHGDSDRADVIRIGGGCDCLIPAQPSREAIEARRRKANQVARGDHVHTVANPRKGAQPGERGLSNWGYRPGRRTARRQDSKR